MLDSYPVMEVQPEWVLEQEDMGTKEKFWYRKPGDDGKDWLFKRPREDTGEHWAEKIAAEVAAALEVPHATVELAEFREQHGEQRGSASESFVSKDQELVHGNQILERTVAEYDPDVRFGQRDHSFKNIWGCFERVYRKRSAADKNRRVFAGYMVLDAVIGNTDRHHENWGLLRRQVGEQRRSRIAPSFDHASSLGREMLDERRNLLLQEKRVGWYAERGRGGVYWGRNKQTVLSPLDLVRKAAEVHPTYFTPALARLAGLRDSSVTEIVNRVPDDWMSPPARAFAIELICYNRSQLMELNR